MRDGDRDSIPELATLGASVHLLETDDRTTAALHSLVIDHLLIHQGEALWADSHGHAQAQSLVRMAPSTRFLDGVRVARAFTAFQHQTLLERLADHTTDQTVLAVVPALDHHYRSDDLARGEPERMLAAALDRIETLAERHDLPVLVTRQRADALSAPLERLADERIRVETTQFGPRFTADGFETLVYRDRTYIQTTFAFWARIVDERQRARARLRQAVVA